MAIKQDEMANLQSFIGSMMNGAAEFGLKALPLVAIYKKAQDDKLDFWQLLLTDETTSQQLTKALERHSEKLPPALIASMKLICNARQQVDLRKKQEAESLAASRTRHQHASGATVSGGSVEEV